MTLTADEKSFYDVFLGLGIDSKSLCYFIEKVRECTTYGSIFNIENLNSFLKSLLSKVYQNTIYITINGKPARDFISKTWSL